MPSEWPRRLILGWSPPGVCLECGQGRVPVVEASRMRDGEPVGGSWDTGNGRPTLGAQGVGHWRYETDRSILGYACSCTPYTDHPGSGEERTWPNRFAADLDYGYKNPVGNRPKVGPWREYHLQGWTPPPTRPAVILDCFGGTGTTSMVARALGRIGLSFDLSHAYSRAARWRIWSDDANKAISRTNRERQGTLL